MFMKLPADGASKFKILVSKVGKSTFSACQNVNLSTIFKFSVNITKCS